MHSLKKGSLVCKVSFPVVGLKMLAYPLKVKSGRVSTTPI